MGAILEAYITSLGKYAEGQLVSSRPLQSAQHRPRRNIVHDIKAPKAANKRL